MKNLQLVVKAHGQIFCTTISLQCTLNDVCLNSIPFLLILLPHCSDVCITKAKVTKTTLKIKNNNIPIPNRAAG